MNRTIALCLVSSVLGALLAASWALVWQSPRPSVAQEFEASGPVPGLEAGWRASDRADRPAADAAGETLTPEERVNIAVYEAVNRSVVNIDTRSVRSDAFFMIEVPTEGSGSGVVIDREGHVVTNHHVVEGAQAIQVTLFDGTSHQAEVVGADTVNDLAVLKIDAPATALFPIVFGDSSPLRVGQRALAIGNPFGLERTLSVGVISSLNRPLSGRREAFRQLIQIDADINPGNSGGPLLDSQGRMIGMNTVIASKTGQSAGVGFAIPVNPIARIVPELIENGRIVRADLGIVAVYASDEGLRIAELAPRGPAERAGLKGPAVIVREGRKGPYVTRYRTVDRSAADLIVGVDGEPVRRSDDLMAIIEGKKPGDRVTLNVLRAGRKKDVAVTLGADG